MLDQVSTRISIFCLAFMVGIGIPKISWGITNLNLNNYQPSSDLATNRKTDTSLNPTTADKKPSPSRSGKPIYLAQRIICQRRLRPYILLRRISYPNVGCFDEIVYTLTRKILQRSPAPCDQNC